MVDTPGGLDPDVAKSLIELADGARKSKDVYLYLDKALEKLVVTANEHKKARQYFLLAGS